MVDRCFFINLDRSTARRAAFERNVADVDWPFPLPVRFSAVDAEPPDWYLCGRGAWGCLQSHLAILHRCLSEGVESVAIFEDDAVFPDQFGLQVRQLMAAVPTDWHQVYLCGNHAFKPEVVNSQVLRCKGTNLTTAFLFQRGGLSKIHALLASVPGVLRDSNAHIDVLFCTLHQAGLIRAYSPWRSIVGQRAGPSDRIAASGGSFAWERDEYFPLSEDVLKELESAC